MNKPICQYILCSYPCGKVCAYVHIKQSFSASLHMDVCMKEGCSLIYAYTIKVWTYYVDMYARSYVNSSIKKIYVIFDIYRFGYFPDLHPVFKHVVHVAVHIRSIGHFLYIRSCCKGLFWAWFKCGFKLLVSWKCINLYI